MNTPFKKVPAQVSFSQQEHDVLKLWEELAAFPESNKRRKGNKKPFVFYDGPPFATGTPHYGHLLAGTIKDIVPRYWNMRGHPVERRFGWDCHGLPIEALAQDELGLAGTGQILEKGVDVFNEKCRSMVQTYVDEWRKTVTRMGRWVDFENDYKTMDTDFMESIWWVFKQLWDQGRIYKSYRIMPYSWKLTTPLSNFEANSNYKHVQDPAVTVRFRVDQLPAQVNDEALTKAAAEGQLYLLAWTTTPWTLPSNLALGVGPEIEYVALKQEERDEVYLVAKERAAPGKVFPKLKKGKALEGGERKVLGTLKGADLVGAQYQPLFDYFKEQPHAFQVLAGDFVTTESGTGIVHLAPAYGEDDFAVCKQAQIDLVDPLNAEAEFTAQVPEFEGQFCKDADKEIIALLKERQQLVFASTIEHSYPFDDRTETPLIYRAIEAWYVRVQDMRDDLVEANDQVGWVPEAVGKNRFGNWLKDANDWNISRNRFWGSCIPIWVNEADPTDMICVGSIEELHKLSGVRVDDLHKHIVDEVLIEKDGKRYRRTPEVLDCWFESGAMPYAQQHYPFKEGDAGDGSDDRFKSFFPAQFIAEGLDQTRGWFYTLLILGTALFKRAPYENVIVNGLILAEDGHKMSKRKKNYPDPNLTVEEYGADALRAYMIDSPVVRGEPLKFSEKGLKEIVRTVVLPYWNALSFFSTYASLDGYDPRSAESEAPPIAERPAADRWLLSVMQSLIQDVNQEMEAYRLYAVVPRLVRFIDDLTNWYIRTNRARFWKSSNKQDQNAAYATLYEALTTFAQVLAPFMPFVTEMVHQRLVVPVYPEAPKSVHFCDYPQANDAVIDNNLEAQMSTVRAVVTLARKLREDHKVKVRQPLSRLSVVHRSSVVQEHISKLNQLIIGELNVKVVDCLADESQFLSVTVKPNFKTLSKRCGKKLGKIKVALAAFGFAEVAELESGARLMVEGEELSLEDVYLERSTKGDAAVATDGNLTCVLDTTLTPELVAEGFAREFVSVVQAARKSQGFEVSDRIDIACSSEDSKLMGALEVHSEMIQAEVLAESLIFTGGTEVNEVNGSELRLSLNRRA